MCVIIGATLIVTGIILKFVVAYRRIRALSSEDDYRDDSWKWLTTHWFGKTDWYYLGLIIIGVVVLLLGRR